uniref:Transmembrane protein n=1 Tax=Panagrolaimus sp. JU765 TaxID=591449 RepID=A0AC34Q4X7_9BILA
MGTINNYLILFLCFGHIKSDEIVVDKEGEYELIVPSPTFGIEICQETATQEILFCYEGKSNEAGDIGCGYGYCGGSMFLIKDSLAVEVKVKDYGYIEKCEDFFISEGGIEARVGKKFSSCNWKKNADDSLKLRVAKFPPGWRMTIKRVDTSKARAKLIASFWWAYLLGIIAVIGLVIGIIFLVRWWLKKKKNIVEKQAESGPELKEVKVVEDRKQKEKVDSEKKETKSQSKPRSTPKKQKNPKVSKPKHVLTPSKEEEAPKSLGISSEL